MIDNLCIALSRVFRKWNYWKTDQVSFFLKVKLSSKAIYLWKRQKWCFGLSCSNNDSNLPFQFFYIAWHLASRQFESVKLLAAIHLCLMICWKLIQLSSCKLLNYIPSVWSNYYIFWAKIYIATLYISIVKILK